MGSPSHQPPLEILLGYEFLKGNREVVSVIEIVGQSHQEVFFFSKFKFLFTYLWLRWVFIAAHGLSLIVVPRLATAVAFPRV